MNKAIFLDRDGTINVDYGYVHSISKFEFLKNSIEGLKILNDLGYKLVIITNQSGIGRGYYTIDDYNKLNNYMLEKLGEFGINIAKVYMCPHISSDNCNCRKPKLELFYKAIKELNIDTSNSFAIGDRERDLAICNVEDVSGILLTSDTSDKYICKNDLLDAAKYIKKINR
ncbi:MAG: HAD family hydrolase [Bacilli bacterium]|nr:HAD family hydrolase [Bacilli bacterium]